MDKPQSIELKWVISNSLLQAPFTTLLHVHVHVQYYTPLYSFDFATCKQQNHAYSLAFCFCPASDRRPGNRAKTLHAIRITF